MADSVPDSPAYASTEASALRVAAGPVTGQASRHVVGARQSVVGRTWRSTPMSSPAVKTRRWLLADQQVSDDVFAEQLPGSGAVTNSQPSAPRPTVSLTPICFSLRIAGIPRNSQVVVYTGRL